MGNNFIYHKNDEFLRNEYGTGLLRSARNDDLGWLRQNHCFFLPPTGHCDRERSEVGSNPVQTTHFEEMQPYLIVGNYK